MIIEKRDRSYEINNDYLYIVITLLLTTVIFFLLIVFEHKIYRILNVVNFLTWHILLELFSVIISFIIFT